MPKKSRLPVPLGYTNVTEVGSRLRSVTQKRKQGRFSIMIGFKKRLRSVTQNRLRMVS